MATPLNILPHVFKWEGGLVFHDNENQFANMGIQYSTYLALCEKLLQRKPSLDHFKALKKYEAQKFIEYFWNRATYNNAIKNQDAANVMFQALWGSGPTGIKEMQKALNTAFKNSLAVDGITGPKTVAVINQNSKSSHVLFAALVDYYNRLGSKPEYSKYLRGWLNRLEELRPFMFTGAGMVVILFFTFLFFK